MKGDRCPICGKDFKSDECPHSYGDVAKREQQSDLDKRINKLIDARLEKYGLVKFK